MAPAQSQGQSHGPRVPLPKNHITSAPKESPSQIIALPPEADVALGNANGEAWQSKETAFDNANHENSGKESTGIF